MTDLDKLEAALRCNAVQDYLWFRNSYGADAGDVIKDAARAHLANSKAATQRQAPADRAAVAAFDYIMDILNAELAICDLTDGNIDRLERAEETIRAALANSVPVDVLEGAYNALGAIADQLERIGDSRKDKPFIEDARGALRDLEPWVKGVR